MARAEATEIDGVFLSPIAPRTDERGSFSELYRSEWIPNGREMVQGNLSESSKGVLRGLHFHRRQTDYWVVLSGNAFVGLFDLRANSSSGGRKVALHLEEDPRRGLYIPPGVAHGFYAETRVQLLYLVDQLFTGEDEHGVAWNDPDIGIAWPSRTPILSDRDRANPTLAEARSVLAKDSL